VPRFTRRRLGFSAGIVFLVIVLIAGAAAGYLWHLNDRIHRVAVHGLVPAPKAGKAGPGENILLVGSTSRCALTVQNPAYGLCSQGVSGVNSDVVMIVHLVPDTHTATLLSIPRDTFMPNARAEGANKIDAALYEGPSQLVAAIEDDFGVPIQHYIELNFQTFAKVVNDLGGLGMYFPREVYDAYSGLDVRSVGCRHLDGVEALQVVRARHLQYKGPGVRSENPHNWPQETQSDLARIQRDHEFLRVLAAKVAHEGIGNPFTDLRIAEDVAPNLEVDSGFSASDIAHLMATFHSVNAAKVAQYTIPVAVSTFGSYIYQGGNYGDVVFPVQSSDRRIVDRFLAISAATDPLSGRRLPAPAAVRVSVVDGFADPARSASAAAKLRTLGFDLVSDSGVAVPVSTQAAETVVAYDGRAHEAAALAVTRELTGYVSLDNDPSLVTPGAQVTLVTGSFFRVSKTTPRQVPPGFQAPSAATPPLAPWDPRSCTTSGGEGS
jgi:LCP family protein required for cell wall assembly